VNNKRAMAFGLVTLICVVSAPLALAGQQSALTEIINEPKVISAAWLSGKRLIASVFDDGWPRRGYAAFLCNVLHLHGVGADATAIVIDARSVTKSGRYRTLGTAYCNFPSRRR